MSKKGTIEFTDLVPESDPNNDLKTLFDNSGATAAEVADQLASMCTTTVADFVTVDKKGNLKLKAFDEIPEHKLKALKKIRITPKGQIEIELADKLTAAKYVLDYRGLKPADKVDSKEEVILKVETYKVTPAKGGKKS